MATVSPCRKICRYEGGQFCVGCRRHTSEISLWSSLTDEQALAIMATLPDREIPT